MGCVLSSSSGTCYCCVESTGEESWNKFPSGDNPQCEQPKGWGLASRNYTWFYREPKKKKKRVRQHPQQFHDGISVVPSGEPHPEGLSGRRSPLHPICGPPLPATPSGAYQFMDRSLGPTNCPKFKRFGTFSGKKGFRLHPEKEELPQEEEEIYRAHSETYELFQPGLPMSMRNPLMEKFFSMQSLADNQQLQRQLPSRTRKSSGNGVHHSKGMAPMPPARRHDVSKLRDCRRQCNELPPPPPSSNPPCRTKIIQSSNAETIIKLEPIPHDHRNNRNTLHESRRKDISPQVHQKVHLQVHRDASPQSRRHASPQVPQVKPERTCSPQVPREDNRHVKLERTCSPQVPKDKHERPSSARREASPQIPERAYSPQVHVHREVVHQEQARVSTPIVNKKEVAEMPQPDKVKQEKSLSEVSHIAMEDIPAYVRKSIASNLASSCTGLHLLDMVDEPGPTTAPLLSFCQTSSLQRHLNSKNGAETDSSERCASATPMLIDWGANEDDQENTYYNQINFLSLANSRAKSSSIGKLWSEIPTGSALETNGNAGAVAVEAAVDALRYLHSPQQQQHKQQNREESHKTGGMKSVHEAASMGCVSCLRWLVEEQGMDPNAADSDGSTALHLAAKKGHTEVVRWLLATGASLTFDMAGKGPINYAADNEHMECLSVLIMYGTGSGAYDNGPFHIKEEFKASKCVCHQNGKNGLVVQNGGAEDSSVVPGVPPATSGGGPLASSSPREREPFFLHPPRSSSGRGCGQHPEEVYLPSHQSDPGTTRVSTRWAESRMNKQGKNKHVDRAKTLNLKGSGASNCDCSKQRRNGDQGFFLHQPWKDLANLDERARDLFQESQSKNSGGSDSGSESGYAEIGENFPNKDSRNGSMEGSVDTPRNSGNSDESYSELSDPAADNDYEDIYISSEDQQDEVNGRPPTPPPVQMAEDRYKRAQTSKNHGDEAPEEGIYSPGSIPPPPEFAEFDDTTLQLDVKLGQEHDSYQSTKSEKFTPPPPPPPPERGLDNGHGIYQNEKFGNDEADALHKYRMESTYGSSFAMQSNEAGGKRVSRRSRSSSLSAVDEAFAAVLELDDPPEQQDGNGYDRGPNGDVPKEEGGPHFSKQHLIRHQLMSSFIPPKFPNPCEEDTLIKPSEYLKTIGNKSSNSPPSPPNSRAAPIADDKDQEEGKYAGFVNVLPAIPESEGPAAPAPPPTPAAPPMPPPPIASSAPPSPQLLSAISVRELNSVQLRRTDNKVTKTLSAPVIKTDLLDKECALVLQKDDLIAELKLSKDIDGIKKLKHEKMQVQTKHGRVAEDDFLKQFTAENFISKIPEADSAGTTIPIWKRLMMAKKAAEKARQEAEDRILKEREERRIQAIPAWKRQLLQKKGTETTRSHPNLFTALSLDDSKSQEDQANGSPAKENGETTQNEQETQSKSSSEDEMDDQPIIPWRAQLRKTNSTLNLNE